MLDLGVSRVVRGMTSTQSWTSSALVVEQGQAQGQVLAPTLDQTLEQDMALQRGWEQVLPLGQRWSLALDPLLDLV